LSFVLHHTQKLILKPLILKEVESFSISNLVLGK